MTRKLVLENTELIDMFQAVLSQLYTHNIVEEFTRIIYKEIVTRVVNTAANDFLKSQAMLDRIAQNKGVDAEVALRDKLKVFANEACSRLQFNN